jgi:hypothetical protein
MNSGVDRSMTFDLFESEDGGDVTQNICRPQASAK